MLSDSARRCFRELGIDSMATYRRRRAGGERSPTTRVRRRVPGGRRLGDACGRTSTTLERDDHRARRAGPVLRRPRGRHRDPLGGVPARRCGTCSAPGSSCGSATRPTPDIGRAKAARVPEGRPGRGLTRDRLHFLTALPRIDGVRGPARPRRRHRRPGRREWSRRRPGRGPTRPAAAGPVRPLRRACGATAWPPVGRDRPGCGSRSASTRRSWPRSPSTSTDEPHLLVFGDRAVRQDHAAARVCSG